MGFKRLSVCLLVIFLAPIAIAKIEPDLAQQWDNFMASQLAKADPVIKFPYERCFRRAAARYQIPLLLLLAVARGESDFNPKAVSSANARGLMQILWPTTAHHLGIFRESALFDPCINIDAGARYLDELLDRYDGNLHLALAAYNFGPSRIDPKGKRIPQMANWYSGYIYKHLTYVAGTDPTHQIDQIVADYSKVHRTPLLVFQNPVLAENFVSQISKQAPHVRLEIFKTYFNRYRVILLTSTADEFRRSRRSLIRAGLRMEE